MHNLSSQKHTFTWTPESFMLDNHKFQIFSGELHYQRIPKEYWRHRLQMARTMGLNAVAIYMFWNHHEPQPNTFDFSENNDVVEFIRIAQEEELWVILRPGPYCCGEWDFGGLPPYLLAKDNIRVRCMDEEYLKAMDRYIEKYSSLLTPFQCTQGGPILMIQIENEYGSYGNDHTYLRHLAQKLNDVGWDILKFTCDGPGDYFFKGGNIPEILPMVNFGNNPENNFRALDKYRPNIPHMCMEYYPGWFNHWSDLKLISTNALRIKQITQDLEWMITHQKSFNLYMFHGGTNFGFSAGANFSGKYQPDITSYDYSAPVDESGTPTDQFFAYRTLMKKYLASGEKLKEIPDTLKHISIPLVEFSESTNLFSNMRSPIKSAQIHSMEYYGHYEGQILYRTTLIPAYQHKKLVIRDLHDYGYLFIGGNKIATFNRSSKKDGVCELKIPTLTENQTLDILVENHGRINYGAHLLDRKGITQYVAIDDNKVLMDWQIFCIRLDTAFFNSCGFSTSIVNTPALHRGYFDIHEVGDTFLDLRAWKKGMVWVNGHGLGRFWNIGPQKSLYLPGPWLKHGKNEVILYDMEGTEDIRKLKKIRYGDVSFKELPVNQKWSRPPISGSPKPIKN